MVRRVQAGRFYGATSRRCRIGSLVLVESVHPAGSHLPRHTHERAYFCVNLGGTYVEQYGRRRRTCHPGMVVFHPPGEVHEETHATVVRSLNVEVGSDWLQQVFEASGPLDRPAEFHHDRIASAGVQLVRESTQTDGDSALAVESLAFEILAACVGWSNAVTKAEAPRWVREAHELLAGGLQEPASLRRLAQHAGVHPVHFAATFRRFYGLSVGEYVRRQRLDYARRQLAARADVSRNRHRRGLRRSEPFHARIQAVCRHDARPIPHLALVQDAMNGLTILPP